MRANDYGDLIEPWKVDLIVARAKRIGFRDYEIEDVQQELIFEVLDFKYETGKSNGATEATALTTVIDRRLIDLRRSEESYRARQERIVSRSSQAVDPPAQDLAIDVQRIIDSLPERERQVCRALSLGRSVQATAKDMGCGWHTARRMINRIRERFEEMGLNGCRRG